MSKRQGLHIQGEFRMTTTSDDLSIVLSGGTININPNLSLGGNPSSSPIPSGVLNNLFSDVASEREDDLEHYRCIYIFNDGNTTIWNVQAWIQQLSEDDGSYMEIGIQESNEFQRITINGSVSGGSLSLRYKNSVFTFNHSSDLMVWANRLQQSLENLLDPSDSSKVFRNVTVRAQSTGVNQVIFDITWSGKDSKRNLEKIETLVDENQNDIGNQLLPLGSIIVSKTTVRQGSPVNTIAQQIDVETTPPGDVGFFAASATSPVSIPRLDPEEGFPIWIKRFVPLNAIAKQDDGFSLVIRAQSLEAN